MSEIVPGLPPVDEPTLLLSGTFAVYQEPGPDGGVRLSYRRTGATEDEFLHAPAALLRAMQGMGEGGMFGAFKGMLRIGRSGRH